LENLSASSVASILQSQQDATASRIMTVDNPKTLELFDADEARCVSVTYKVNDGFRILIAVHAIKCVSKPKK
jgi:hypothetical protein